MTPQDQQIFDDVAKIAIYHFADLMYKQQAHEAAARLAAVGLVFDPESTSDAEKAYEKYEELMAEYVLGRLPGDYSLTYDYWGARCFSNQRGWEYTKNGFLAGDVWGRLAWYADFAALKTRVDEFLDELSENECEMEYA